jgi:anti-sigma factor RsiW
MNDTNQRLPVDDIEALLPWYAAGTLDAREADQVEAAIATNAELARRLDLVREEMTESIILNEALGVPSARVMEKLFKAIDQERRAARGPAARTGIGSWLADLLTPRAFAFGAGAAMLLITLEAGVIAKLALLDRPEPGATYETQSTTKPSASVTRGFDVGVYALVRFAPQASMADVTRFLNSREALIIDGPQPGGPGGLYKVRIARSYVPREEIERLVREFQSGSGNVVATAMPAD